MKTKFVFPWVAVALLVCDPMGSLAAAKTQTLAVPTEIQGLPCQGKLVLRDDGSVTTCTLSRAHQVAGLTLPAGTEIRFNEARELASCTLGQTATVVGFSLPAGARVEFRKGRAVSCTLPRAAEVRGLPLPAGSTLFFVTTGFEKEVPVTWQCWLPVETTLQGYRCAVIDEGCGHILYPSGKIRAIKLAQDEEIDGVPCTSSQNPLRMGTRVMFYGLDAMAWFYEDGRLAQGMVSRDWVIQGRACKRGDIVRLRSDGTLDPTEKTLGAASRRSRAPGR